MYQFLWTFFHAGVKNNTDFYSYLKQSQLLIEQIITSGKHSGIVVSGQ